MRAIHQTPSPDTAPQMEDTAALGKPTRFTYRSFWRNPDDAGLESLRK
ncbi:hypothetical protein SAMN02799642_03419 [Methylobacterium brachiatum]|nr:hypothetical protein SAMN02799642_03419 [Methylobacterium brachiatum]